MQPLHRVTIGRTRETRGPDALERGIAGLIIVAAVVVASASGTRLIQMAQTVDAVSVAAGPEIDAIVYHSVQGRWPPAQAVNTFAFGRGGLYVKHLALGSDGAITAQLTLQPDAGFPPQPGHNARGVVHGNLSFRPELLGTQDAPTVSFLCGYAKPTDGAIRVNGVNQTTLPKKYLPPFCR